MFLECNHSTIPTTSLSTVGGIQNSDLHVITHFGRLTHAHPVKLNHFRPQVWKRGRLNRPSDRLEYSESNTNSYKVARNCMVANMLQLSGQRTSQDEQHVPELPPFVITLMAFRAHAYYDEQSSTVATIQAITTTNC